MRRILWWSARERRRFMLNARMTQMRRRSSRNVWHSEIRHPLAGRIERCGRRRSDQQKRHSRMDSRKLEQGSDYSTVWRFSSTGGWIRPGRRAYCRPCPRVDRARASPRSPSSRLRRKESRWGPCLPHPSASLSAESRRRAWRSRSRCRKTESSARTAVTAGPRSNGQLFVRYSWAFQVFALKRTLAKAEG